MCKGSFVTAARVALAAATLAGLAGSATAADLARAPAPYQPPPPPSPVFSWTGCYVGANVGGGWASNSSNDVAGAVTGVAGADPRCRRREHSCKREYDPIRMDSRWRHRVGLRGKLDRLRRIQLL